MVTAIYLEPLYDVRHMAVLDEARALIFIHVEGPTTLWARLFPFHALVTETVTLTAACDRVLQHIRTDATDVLLMSI